MIVKPLLNRFDMIQTIEESKDEFDLTTALKQKCDDFLAVNQAYSVALEAELHESKDIRRAQEALVERLHQKKAAVESKMKVTLQKIDQDIQQVQE